MIIDYTVLLTPLDDRIHTYTQNLGITYTVKHPDP